MVVGFNELLPSARHIANTPDSLVSSALLSLLLHTENNLTAFPLLRRCNCAHHCFLPQHTYWWPALWSFPRGEGCSWGSINFTLYKKASINTQILISYAGVSLSMSNKESDLEKFVATYWNIKMLFMAFQMKTNWDTGHVKHTLTTPLFLDFWISGWKELRD